MTTIADSNVIEFHHPARRGKPKPKAPTFNAKNRTEWVAAVRVAWADPARWETYGDGDHSVVIEELGVTVTIGRSEESAGYWSWKIRFSDGRRAVSSNWTYVREGLVCDAALDAVIALA